jgi:signal recognition particle subunit SEC65
MAELFPPTLAELVAAAEREVRFREFVYPRRIAAHRMTAEKAEKEIALMKAIVEELKKR